MKNKFAHGGNIYEAMRKTGGEWLDFSANINPLGLSLEVKSAIEQAIPFIIHYPDSAGTALRQSLSEKYGIGEKNIVLGNGAVELLYVLCQLKRPRRVLIPSPAFNEYERAASAAGAKINYLPLDEKDGFKFSLEILEKNFNGEDMLFWGNPCNPTGILLTLAELEKIAAFTKSHSCYFVIDQSFIDFREDYEKYSAHCLIEKYPSVMVLHSLTKFYAIPGLRLGFASLNEDDASKMEMLKDQWNVNSLAQAAGEAALKDTDYQARSYRKTAENRQYLWSRLKEFPSLKTYEPTVNFILVRLLSGAINAVKLAEKMRSQHILIRDCSNYPALSDEYVRFAIKNKADNDRLLAALAKILEEVE
jgi:threonine-phosphate decarboxylase